MTEPTVEGSGRRLETRTFRTRHETAAPITAVGSGRHFSGQATAAAALAAAAAVYRKLSAAAAAVAAAAAAYRQFSAVAAACAAAATACR